MGKLLLISFDAVGDNVLPALLARPHTGALAARAALARGVASLFLTNTYPVHASIVTGLPQAEHGLVSNTEPFPLHHPRWNTRAALIRAETLWQAAAAAGKTVAAVMWPVTGGARDIRWNIPELMIQPGQNQVVENLKAGSKWLQLRLFLRHRRLLQGIAQPARDRFATACMNDILREKKPDLALMHLTAYDSLCHEFGPGAPELEAALDALDDNLGALLAAAGPEYGVVVFSDHSQLPVHTALLPNDWLVAQGLMEKSAAGDYVFQSGRPEGGAPGCYYECCGGAAFFHPWRLGEEATAAARADAEGRPGFGRFLAEEELAACGRADLPFGFAPAVGYACEAYPGGEKGNHGYPVDYPDYKVFYLAAGPGFAAGARLSGGDLLDVAPLAARALGLRMDDLRPAREEMLV